MPATQPVEPLPFFSSGRERRLWAWTLALVITIYATLGLASTLAGLVSEWVLGVMFVLSLFLVGATVLTQGLKTRPRGIELGVAIGIVGVYMLFFVRCNLPERSHLIEYSVVAVLIYEALSERASQGRHVRFPALIAMVATSLIGTIDECIQTLIPNRYFDWQDILFNVLASVMAISAMVTLGWARRWTTKPRRK